MRRRTFYWISAATIGVASAAIAYPVFGLISSTPNVTQRTLNGYAFGEPAGGSSAVPTVFVFSDDKVRYNRIGYRDKRLHFDLRASQQCGGGKWSEAGVPGVKIGDRTWPSGGGKPIPTGNTWHPVLDVALEKLSFGRNVSPVDRCNAVIQDYTMQGRLPGALLQQGFWVRVDDAVSAEINSSCKYHPSKKGLFDEPPQLSPSQTVKLPVWVRCMPTGYVQTRGPPPRPGRPASDYPPIKSIELASTNSPLRHTCPATVVFRGRIEAGRSVKGSYRFVGSGNYASPTYPFTIAAGAAKSVVWQRRVELPNTIGNITTGGAGNWPRRVSGWLQLEVVPEVSNAQAHRSQRANFEVDCLKPPSAQDRLKSGGIS